MPLWFRSGRFGNGFCLQRPDLILHDKDSQQVQVLLVHPGGSFWRNKDDGSWSIPKGEVNPGEDLLAAARREFVEETGFAATGNFIQLKPIALKSGKIVHAWAIEGDFDTTKLKSNMFSMEWPPKSGKRAEFPEVDAAEFFDVQTALRKRIRLKCRCSIIWWICWG